MTDGATYLEIENASPRAMAIVSDALRAEGLDPHGLGGGEERRSAGEVVLVVGTVVVTKFVDRVADKTMDAAIDAAIAAVKERWGIVVRRRSGPTGRHTREG